MLIHNNKYGSYEVASSNAARAARQKMEGLIDAGQAKAAGLFNTLHNSVPKDRLVSPNAMKFSVNGHFNLLVQDERFDLHKHARGQVIDATNGLMTRKVAESMQEAGPWGQEMLSNVLNTIYANIGKDKMLLREVGGQVRAVLSNRYRRMDSAPIIESFAGACGSLGAVPIEAHKTDTKWALKVLLPVVFEPVQNEVMAYGAVLENSDFGDGALSLRTFMLRLWCTNYAIREEALRQVHLGRRLDDSMMFSSQTYDLDTRAMGSAIQDIVRGLLSPVRVQKDLALIKAANEQSIDASKVIDGLHKANQLNKEETKEVSTVYNSAEVELLPPGNSLWRLSNALSLFAQSREDGRRLELERLAGSVLAR